MRTFLPVAWRNKTAMKDKIEIKTAKCFPHSPGKNINEQIFFYLFDNPLEPRVNLVRGDRDRDPFSSVINVCKPYRFVTIREPRRERAPSSLA